MAVGAVTDVLREHDVGEIGAGDVVRRSGDDARKAGASVDLVDEDPEVDGIAGFGVCRLWRVAENAEFRGIV